MQLSLEYEPEGIVETLGDKLHVVDRQVEADLKRFKDFIEDEGYASGAWRGTVNEGAPPGLPELTLRQLLAAIPARPASQERSRQE